MLGRIVVHPPLFASYAVLFLVAQNLEEQVTLGTAALSLATVVVATGAAFLVLATLLRSPGRGGALTSLYVFLFFSFGHLATLFEGAENVLVVVWLALAAVGSVLIVRAEGELPTATMALNVISVVLVVMNVVPIVRFEPGTLLTPIPEMRELEVPEPGEVAWDEERDIYYLIFDRYARSDVLEEMYGFDNRPFLRELERRGFFVANSVSNHQRTAHSVASSLNMTYLTHLEEKHPASSDYGPIYRMLKNSMVSAFLRQLGYTHHHVGSWWNPTERVPTADVNHLYDKAISEFSGLLLDSTLWPALLDLFGLGDEGRTHRGRVRFQFRELRSIATDPDPTFTFAHFLVPHPPYVFNADGSPATERDLDGRTPEESYIEQLRFTNDEILKLLDDLMAGPDGEDPIVVLQSDEGPHPARFEREKDAFDWWEATDDELREKLLILNAYYLPGGGETGLYPSISPVNTFRLIFNAYFGTDLKLLEDRTYIWRDREHLYDFREIREPVYPSGG